MPTNLYGPGDNFDEMNGHVLPSLMRRFHEAKEKQQATVEVWGTGTPLREFLFIDDLANAIEFIIVNNVDPGLYNIGSNQEVTIKSLVENVKDVVNFPGEIVFDETKKMRDVVLSRLTVFWRRHLRRRPSLCKNKCSKNRGP